MIFQVWQCQEIECGFRYPVTDERVRSERCPACGGTAQLAGEYPPSVQPQTAIAPSPLPLEVLLDNIRSVYNVGSMFRTADGVGIAHMHLGGITPPPDHPKIKKTALGAETAVSHTRSKNGLATAAVLQQQGYHLWALEATATSVSLFEAVRERPLGPLLLIVGNEVAGVDPAILDLCDRIVHLPMQGRKESLNVASAFAVAVYVLKNWDNGIMGSSELQ